MKTLLTAALVSSAFLLLFLRASAKDEQPGREELAPPKPGPEHDILKKDAGIWDATIQEMTEPGAPPKESKGVETNTLACGGLWLVTDFKGEMMGQPFQGHG